MRPNTAFPLFTRQEKINDTDPEVRRTQAELLTLKSQAHSPRHLLRRLPCPSVHVLVGSLHSPTPVVS